MLFIRRVSNAKEQVCYVLVSNGRKKERETAFAGDGPTRR